MKLWKEVSWISQGSLPLKLGWYNSFGTDNDEVSVRDHLDLIVALVLQSHASRETERQCLGARAEIQSRR